MVRRWLFCLAGMWLLTGCVGTGRVGDNEELSTDIDNAAATPTPRQTTPQGRITSTPAPLPTPSPTESEGPQNPNIPPPDPNSNDNPNHLVNFGKPEPVVSYDPAAHLQFDAANLYPEEDNGYPDCQDPVQYDFGYTQVVGCPNPPKGKQLLDDGYCHVREDAPIGPMGSNPPASGNHFPSPSKSLGDNATPIARGFYVHSMEHGAVILAYNCPQGCPYELQVLREVVAARADRKFKVLLTPDPLLPANAFAAISWTWLWRFNVPDMQGLLCFIDQHYNHGRENDKVL